MALAIELLALTNALQLLMALIRKPANERRILMKLRMTQGHFTNIEIIGLFVIITIP